MAISELSILFRRCLHRRISANEFRQLLKQYLTTSTYSSKDVVFTFANCSTSFCIEGDPLLAQYLQILIIDEFFTASELITALCVQWNKTRGNQKVHSKLIPIYTRTITDLTMIIASSALVRDVKRCVILSSRWLESIAKLTQNEVNPNETQLVEAVGFLTSNLLNNSTTSDKNVQASVQSALDQCMTSFPNISMQLMAKMSVLPKSSVFGSQDQQNASSHMMNMAAFEFEANIHNTAVTASKSATTAYLNGLLRNGSTIDDSILFSFLNTRHQGNHATIFNDLVFASIDAMIKTADSQNQTYQNQCQIFMLNKLPSILAFITTSAFESFSSESLLTDAWNHISTSGNTDHVTIGQRFLQICTLYHLVSSESVNSIIGDDGSVPLKGLYAKEDLVSNVTANHSRGPRLVDELLKHDGNAGSISQAILEIMHNYCHMKETQHLKDMANTIIRKPASINTISIFIRPSLFLSPFCSLLDNWKWDEIHGESQPVYDEFGSVLLLICAFQQRLNLKNSELGIQLKQGFLAKYIAAGHAEQNISKLTNAAQTHLGDWIKSFYIDEVLSDDMTTNCSAQEFYMLVPTFLRQSMLAHSMGKLTTEIFKSRLEYLLNPFLLPSLLPAFGWIAQIADREPQAALIVMQTLTHPPGSSEAREIHQTILSMAGDKLEAYNLSKNSAIGSIVSNMAKDGSFKMDTSVHESDMVTWRGADGGVSALLRQEIASQASASDGSYNPRLLIGALQTHGAKSVLNLFITLLLHFSGSHEFHLLLDFMATVVATSENQLRSAIHVLHSNIGSYLKKGENLYAEAVLHLYRRVDLYMTALTAQDLGMDHSFAPMAGLNVANVNLDAGAAPTFDQNAQTQNEDIDQVLNEAAVLGNLDQVDNTGFDEMYGLSGGDLGLGSLDDLDLDMF